MCNKRFFAETGSKQRIGIFTLKQHFLLPFFSNQAQFQAAVYKHMNKFWTIYLSTAINHFYITIKYTVLM